MKGHAYRFATAAQWSACLFDRVDRDAFESRAVIQPLASYEQTARLIASAGAHAPGVTRAGEIFWRDDAGALHRLTACGDTPDVDPAPRAVARASRIIAARSGFWVIGESRAALELYDEDSLSRLAVLALPGAHVIDIASDGQELVFALVERAGLTQVLRLDCAGREVGAVVLDDVTDATAFVYLRRSRRFVVASGVCPRLSWFAAAGGAALRGVMIGALHPCFRATALGTDGRDRAFLAGNDGAEFGGKPFVLVFDADGESLGEVALDPLDSIPTGVSGTRDSLLVTGPRGLLRFEIASVVPVGTPEARCTIITPVLHSPDRQDSRRWLRIEAAAALPAGASLEISYAATADAAQRERLMAIAADRTVPAALRIQRLRQEPGVWSAPVAFAGGGSATAYSAPLFDAREPHVWACITLSASAGGALPALRELAVLYPGQTLMQNLPAIYRRAETQPGNFLRALVGVLETTTQEIDTRIASLAGLVHPGQSTGPWLDFVARWLGLPWDDSLDVAVKQRLISSAAALARQRGTRAGLELLLRCLLPATTRFRIVDLTADVGFATVGGGACRGSVLPAMLGGFTPAHTVLDETSRLGRMRLPCPGVTDDGVRGLVGALRIDIAASREERNAWEPWLSALIASMVPLTARPRLRWLGPTALRDSRLGARVLEGDPATHLGSDAVTGVARLPGRGDRITTTGADIGTRLQ